MVRSIGRIADGSSTAHSTVVSRRGSAQIGQRSSSAKLKHTEQGRRRSVISAIASDRPRERSGGAFIMWKASRCALRGPMPGSRASSATSRSMVGVSTRVVLEA